MSPTDVTLSTALDGLSFAGPADLREMAGLTADSRQVGEGFLFAALEGAHLDGRAFIPAAIAAGARYILAPTGTTLPPGTQGVTLITDDEPRRRLALLAAAFHRVQPKTLVAVTGTNGKTSTVQFTRQLWSLLGHKAGALGTLGVVADGLSYGGSMTTPDPVELHKILAALAGSGVDHVAMEASSHGLHQHRLDGVRLSAAAFTNLTRDHLDYHGTMEAYFAAKAILFDRLLPEGGTAVVNADIPEAAELARRAERRGLRFLDFGHRARALRLVERIPVPHGQILRLEIEGRPTEVELPLVGAFQAMNVLTALGLVIGSGADADEAVPLLSRLTGVRGRLELVARRSSGAPVYVDYAHTPDGLENALTALRPHTEGRLHVVFGCGGDRDPGKRPVMGEVCARLADVVVVTDDNPRTEDPAAIRAQAMKGCPDARDIGDRARAIREAVAALQPGDVLVVAGKGHEQGQTVGHEVRPFDDATEARAAVRELDGGAA